MNKDIIKYIEIEPDRRILVTSDIHGNLDYLKNVLQKANFSDDDILIIIGDIIEKGPESLKTLRYIMDICKNGNVFVTAGNVDIRIVEIIFKISPESAESFFNDIMNMKKRKRTSLFMEMAEEIGCEIASPEDVLNSKADILSHFKDELSFIFNLPAILDTQNFTFVHGGLRSNKLSDNLNVHYYDLLKYDKFMETDICFDKYVVAGHWPVSLYDDKIQQNNPIINSEKKIISIDGGCSIKTFGQLNLLVIPDINCKDNEIHYISYDKFPRFTAADTQAESADSLNIKWTTGDIEVIEKASEFSYVYHKASGKSLWVPNSFLLSDTKCNDYTDHVLGIDAGDTVALLCKTSKGYIVNKNGHIGWYFGNLI